MASERSDNETRNPDIHGTVGPSPSPADSASRDTSEGPRFRIIRPHDEGGLGKVSVALDTELDREVALKEIKPQFADDESSRSRFLLEAEITGGLEHPGIVPIYGLGASADGRPYYAMRFIRGNNLATAIRAYHEEGETESGPDKVVQLRRLLGRFLDVCNAVYYAHQRGVLHRDLKPGNVMLGEYGETLVVDWGLAKPIGAPEESVVEANENTIQSPLVPRSGSVVDATQLGSAIGSPHYMSPEQARGEHDQLGPAADVYSLGATLYTLLTNRRPIHGDTIETVLEKVQLGPTKTARQENSQVDAALSAICARAMAQEPTDRYATVRALAEDVERYLADEPVRAFPEPLARRTRRWLRKHPRLVGSAAATLIAGIVSAGTIAGVVSSSNQKLGEKNVELADANSQLGVAKEEAETARDEAIAARDEAEVKRREAVMQKQRATAATDFLVQAFDAADPANLGPQTPVQDILEHAATKAADGITDPELKATILWAVGDALFSAGNYPLAISTLEQAVSLRDSLGLGEPREVIRVKDSLAEALRFEGDTERSLELHKENLRYAEDHLGESDTLTDTVRSHLAITHLYLGDYERTKELVEVVVMRARANPPEDLNKFVYPLLNLGAAYLNQGDIRQAKTLTEEALDAIHNANSTDIILLSDSMGLLALAEEAQGNTEKGFEIRKNAYQLTSEKLSPNHPKTLGQINLLSISYGNAGNTQRAMTLLEGGLKSAKSRLGSSHPLTLELQSHLAIVYGHANRKQDALDLIDSALETIEQRYEPDDRTKLEAISYLSRALASIGDHQRALELRLHLLQMIRETRGPTDYRTLAVTRDVAELHEELGQRKEAHRLFKIVYDTTRKTKGELHLETIRAARDFGLSHRALGNLDEALSLFEEQYKSSQTALGPDHPITVEARRSLANGYLADKQFQEASVLFGDLTNRSEAGKVSEIQIIDQSLEAICQLYLGNGSKAQDLLSESYREAATQFGILEDRTTMVWVLYRSVLLLSGEHESLIELCQQRISDEEAHGSFLAFDHAAMGEAYLALGKYQEADDSGDIAFETLMKASESLEQGAKGMEFESKLDTNSFWWISSIRGSYYANSGALEIAAENLQRSFDDMPKDREKLSPLAWQLGRRILGDLSEVHDRWEDSTEKEKWQDELEKFEAQREEFDPLAPDQKSPSEKQQ
ncbi:serine/threonine-protein kinase [Adhaeretor mobilis]|uniref:Serine/threonine-protein kinase PknD n=1 Tax=Adhaeretor mobilis TaxID=1930276 RepID=A0A517N265_9BACT|nr:serine/threonine-protein kinase [Adhaeretor mobilis]QDT01215.1 Serine/threonine-protein kinase PknD [Adhaeretor mobilis]